MKVTAEPSSVTVAEVGAGDPSLRNDPYRSAGPDIDQCRVWRWSGTCTDSSGELVAMIEPKSGIRIWIAAGFTDLRRGFQGLSSIVETALQQVPFSGHVFVFRDKSGDLIKLL